MEVLERIGVRSCTRGAGDYTVSLEGTVVAAAGRRSVKSMFASGQSALATGYEIGDRGRIPREIRDAYEGRTT